MPKEELLDAVWGHRYVAPTTLSSRIKAARQAVGDDGATQRVIRTIHGLGFRVVADDMERTAREWDKTALIWSKDVKGVGNPYYDAIDHGFTSLK